DESDIRLKKTKEVIGFIKCLKAMALEEVFIKKISDVREKEMHFLLIEGILKALLMFVTQASGIVIILLTFSFYNLIEGETPDEGIIFSSLALFSNLMVALFLFPVVLQHLIRAAVSNVP
ncbi:Multidrug resistance protein, partial [Armadillidium nasatum]